MDRYERVEMNYWLNMVELYVVQQLRVKKDHELKRWTGQVWVRLDPLNQIQLGFFFSFKILSIVILYSNTKLLL